MDSYWGHMDPLAPIRLLMFSNVHFSLRASLSGIKLISKIKILHIQFSVTQIRPQPSPLFNIHNLFGVKLLTRLILGLSHLNEHKFNHNLNGCITILMAVLTLSRPALWNLSQHPTFFCTAMIIIQCD